MQTKFPSFIHINAKPQRQFFWLCCADGTRKRHQHVVLHCKSGHIGQCWLVPVHVCASKNRWLEIRTMSKMICVGCIFGWDPSCKHAVVFFFVHILNGTQKSKACCVCYDSAFAQETHSIGFFPRNYTCRLESHLSRRACSCSLLRSSAEFQTQKLDFL